MICEKCAVETETVVCENCGKDIAKIGPYCYACGSKIEIKIEEAEESDNDFQNRLLCSDGACIGIVENGACKLCGKPYVPAM